MNKHNNLTPWEREDQQTAARNKQYSYKKAGVVLVIDCVSKEVREFLDLFWQILFRKTTQSVRNMPETKNIYNLTGINYLRYKEQIFESIQTIFTSILSYNKC